MGVFTIIAINVFVVGVTLLTMNGGMVEARVSPPMEGVNFLQSNCLKDYEVNYLRLVITWTPGSCGTKINCKKGVKSDFIIHGLWPSDRKGKSAHDCCTTEFFHSNKIASIRRELKEIWPSVSAPARPDDSTFWDYQWTKHGRCATKIKGISKVQEYFAFVVKVYRELNLLKVLEQSGIEPSDHKTYQGNRIESVINAKLGVKPSLSCRASGNNRVLNEIGICFDTDLERIDCPQTNRQCSGNVLFLKNVIQSFRNK